MKKVFSLLLAAALVLCAMTVTVFAAPGNASYGDVPLYKGGITIDGKMDEGSYANLKKLELKKKVARETADIELTTFIGKSGIYIGVEVEESSTVYYNPKRTSAYNTGIECYFK